MPSQERIDALVERLDADGDFAAALEGDAFTTLRETGFDDLVVTAEQERDRIGELVDRIYRDEAFRQAVEQDPTRELSDWGIPEFAIAPVLVLAGAPDEVVERATADVEAHLKKSASVAAMAAVLGTLAFAQQASAGSQPAAQAQVTPAALAQVTPAAQAQVTPASQAQVTPAAQAQVTPAAQTQVARPAQVSAQVQGAQVSAQVTKAARTNWQGVQPSRLKAQGRFASLLRTQGTGL